MTYFVKNKINNRTRLKPSYLRFTARKPFSISKVTEMRIKWRTNQMRAFTHATSALMLAIDDEVIEQDDTMQAVKYSAKYLNDHEFAELFKSRFKSLDN